MINLSGKKVTVVGLGKSGLSACQLLLREGAEVFVSEARSDPSLKQAAEVLTRKGVSMEFGGHTREWIRGKDLVVMSPGVPFSSPPFQWAQSEKIPILSEIELGYLFCKGKIIAVTGSNGKSTTVTLLGKMLEEGGKRSFVCGNIGEPFCNHVLKVSEKDWVVLEVSSFQLEQCHSFKPHIAILLNLSPNHLDRHPSLENYISVKRRIAQCQKKEDYFLLNADDPLAPEVGKGSLSQKRYFSRTKKVKGVFLKGRDIFSSLNGREEKVCTFQGFRLPGSHNEENALAAIVAALLAGVKPFAVQKTLATFEGLPHRIEFVEEIEGVRFVDDSKSTTVASTLRAIDALSGPLLLIAGGREKNEDFRSLQHPLLKKVKRIFLIGEAKEKIRSALAGSVETTLAATLEEAVALAFEASQAGETVLLSPMCTSFDMFRDFEERGDHFKENVAMLKARKLHAC
ncbi:MAG: UDP-N-acetylmuramoyl-L-alanine--D-glutamate ligase [Candidatus Omnitrophica bacterium]|nr:UDP-N-acetylmuramoyl-L-alanine--D-glutamate ligase [Candidatus Omnitrophota bacterium]